MKIFISHKYEDSMRAFELYRALDSMGVDAYLDMVDDKIVSSGKLLAEHIKKNINKCTDIIVYMSEKTKNSWWVPFEIGMAAQVDMPTASFLDADVELPDYLSYWPRLKTNDDVAKYVELRKSKEKQLSESYLRKKMNIANFYEELKKELR